MTLTELSKPVNSPKWVRCYDNGGETIDRYTVVFTRLGHKAGMRGVCLYLGMSGQPFHPQGFCQHGESENGPIDRPRSSHLGKKIRFEQLPPDCQRAVQQDYNELWARKAQKEFDDQWDSRNRRLDTRV